MKEANGHHAAEKKQESKAEQVTGNFFSMVPKPATGGSGPLFAGDSKPSSGLFNKAPADEKKPAEGSSLFGNLTGSSLFAGVKKEETNGSLFGSLLAKKPEEQGGSIFGDKREPGKKTGLFDGLLNPSLSNNTGCGSLFANTSTPLAGVFSKQSGDQAGDEDEEAVEGDEDEVPGQEDVTDPTKSTGTYKYETASTELIGVGASDAEKRDELQGESNARPRCRVLLDREGTGQGELRYLQERRQGDLAHQLHHAEALAGRVAQEG